MSSFNLSSHMQTLAQTQKMDQLEQEVNELCEEVTTLRADNRRFNGISLRTRLIRHYSLTRSR